MEQKKRNTTYFPDLDSMPFLQRGEGLKAKILHGEKLMLAFVDLAADMDVPDHSHPHEETIFLMEGKAEFMLGDKKQTITAPVKIIIPPNTYHKFTDISDLTGLEMK